MRGSELKLYCQKVSFFQTEQSDVVFIISKLLMWPLCEKGVL
jgi:hypothetical protein